MVAIRKEVQVSNVRLAKRYYKILEPIQNITTFKNKKQKFEVATCFKFHTIYFFISYEIKI